MREVRKKEKVLQFQLLLKGGLSNLFERAGEDILFIFHPQCLSYFRFYICEVIKKRSKSCIKKMVQKSCAPWSFLLPYAEDMEWCRLFLVHSFDGYNNTLFSSSLFQNREWLYFHHCVMFVIHILFWDIEGRGYCSFFFPKWGGGSKENINYTRPHVFINEIYDSAPLPTTITSVQSLMPGGQSMIYGGKRRLHCKWEHEDDKQRTINKESEVGGKAISSFYFLFTWT